MWRSTKAQVADELGLPPQDERLTWLKFSPIEAHFYRQQHDRCAVRAREVIANYRKSVSSTRTKLQHVQNGDLGIKAPPAELEDRLLSNKEAEKLLDQLRWLRQACVHPQVGSAGIRALQRSPMTMDEILEVLDNLTPFLLAMFNQWRCLGSCDIRYLINETTLNSAEFSFDMLSAVLGSEGTGS